MSALAAHQGWEGTDAEGCVSVLSVCVAGSCFFFREVVRAVSGEIFI